MDERPTDVVGLLTHDYAAWRRVLIGLNLIRFAAVGLLIGLVGLFFGIPIVIILGQSPTAPPWLGFALASCIMGCFSILVLCHLVGMLYCCWAPADFRASRYARLAVVFTVVFVTGLAMAFLLPHLPHLPHWTPRSFPPARRLLDDYAWLLFIILYANWIVAVAAWFRFLRAIAEFVCAPTQAAQINEFIWWFCALAGLPVLLVVGLALLLDTRKLLQKSLCHARSTDLNGPLSR